MLPNLISIGSKNISKERKERSKAVPTFPSIFKLFLFLKKTLKIFSIAKIIFFIIQSAKNIIIIKKIPAKRFESATLWSPSLYSTAAPWTLRHYMPLGMIPLVCGSDRHFKYSFQRKAGTLGQKKKYVSNEIN